MLCQNDFFLKKRKISAKAAQPYRPGFSEKELAQNEL